MASLLCRPAPLLLLALCALAAAQMSQRSRVLPAHMQPQFSFDDGGDHHPARINDYYCRLFGGHHSLCFVPHTRKSCGFVRRRQLTLRESAAVLHRHNMERMLLAQGRIRGRNGAFLPTAANMMQLSYDLELHDIAQAAADRCLGGHDCAQCRDTERFGLGQNFVSSSKQLDQQHSTQAEVLSIKKDPVKHMDYWLKQSKYMTPSIINRLPKGGTGAGHYTQLVWANTYLLGCGWIESGISKGIRARMFCNYGPPGNSVGEPVYRVGAPCSACPRGTRCSDEYPGLCKRV